MFWAYHMSDFFFDVIINVAWLLLLGLLAGMLLRWLMSRNTGWGMSAPRGPWGAPPVFHHGPPPPQPPSALQILQQRYSRGEIDATTFDQMRERLEASEPRER